MNSSDASNPVRSRWSCVEDRGPPPEPISPELVLFDPELARRVRAFAVVGPSLPPAQTPEIRIAEVRPLADRRSPKLRLAITAVGAAASIALVTFATAAVPRADELPYVDGGSPAQDVVTSARTVATTPSRTTGAQTTETRTTETQITETQTTGADTTDAAPAPSKQVPQSVELRWRPVPTADYYNVILWSDGTRLRDYWPRRPRIVLPSRELTRLGAPSGSIVHWFVYPISVEAGARVAGSVHANGSFELPAARRTR